MTSEDGKKILKFLHEAEKLKTLLRHSWLSSGRRESVAEHTWRMALMAFLLNSYLEKPVDLSRVLKMILVHDLVEINYMDNWAFNKQPVDKEEQERKALTKLVKPLPPELKSEITELWEVFEAGRSAEAKFAKAIDKTEVLLQHNEADIKFTNKKEISLNLFHGKEHSDYDKFLKMFRELINEETITHYKKHRIDRKLYKDYL